MNVGMLWFDNDPKADLGTKVKRAAEYYQQKYGESPTICFVHPSMIEPQQVNPGTIEVRASQKILPNHFWIGTDR